MNEFLTHITMFPTVVFTIPLGVFLLYWLTVIFGLIDLDSAEGADGALEGTDGAMEGADGAMEGADGAMEGADGALEGADGAMEGADGAMEGVDGAADGVDGATEGADIADGADGHDSDHSHHGPGAFSSLLMFLGLTGVPMGVMLSVLFLTAWIVSYVSSSLFLNPVPLWRPENAIAFFTVFSSTSKEKGFKI